MPKKIFAVTNVKMGPSPEEFFAAGSELDGTKFTRDQLVALHDAGAIEVRTVDEAPTANVAAADDDAKNKSEGEASSETDGEPKEPADPAE